MLGDHRIPMRGLARALGVEPCTVRRWLREETRVTNFTRLRIEAILRRAGVREDHAWDSEPAFDHPFFADESHRLPRAASGIEPLDGFGRDRVSSLQSPVSSFEEVPMAQKISEEVLKKFRLDRDPFLNELHSSEDVFRSRAHKAAEWELTDAAAHQYFIALVGEIGAGKTVILKAVLSKLARDSEFKISRLRCVEKEETNAYAIMEALIRDFNPSDAPKRSREGRARQIGDLLESMVQARKKPVLVIDEAHALNTRTLRSLKRLYDESEVGFRRSIAIILVGQNTNRDRSYNLQDKLGNWDLREVSERCRLVSLGGLKSELGDYIAFKFAKAGCRREIVAADAVRLLRKTAEENRGWDAPLVVNNVVSLGMNLAYEVGKTEITAELMADAIKAAQCGSPAHG